MIRFLRPRLSYLQRRTLSSSAIKPYYDSQSARWITPHDREYFRFSVDATSHPLLLDDDALLTPLHERHIALIELSSLYSTFVLPSTPILQNNNNIEAHSTMIDDESVMVVPSIFPYHASTSAPSNVIFDVSVDVEKSADVESMVNHVQGHFSKNNRVRSTLTNFSNLSAVDVGSLCGKLCDAGCEEIFLNNVEVSDVDDLLEVMEEICYVDAPGGPMLGRLGLNYIASDEEFLEEAIFNFGCSKLRIKINEAEQVKGIIKDRGFTSDLK